MSTIQRFSIEHREAMLLARLEKAEAAAKHIEAQLAAVTKERDALKARGDKLATALASLGGYALTVRDDRKVPCCGELMCAQTVDWCTGLREGITEAEQTLAEWQKGTQ